jgi:hypothetical protein
MTSYLDLWSLIVRACFADSFAGWSGELAIRRPKDVVTWRTASSGMWRRVALVGTDVSEERIAWIIRVTRINAIVTANSVPGSLILTLMMEAIRSSETLILTRPIRCRIPEYGVLHSHRRGNLKSYINMLSPYLAKHFTSRRMEGVAV